LQTGEVLRLEFGDIAYEFVLTEFDEGFLGVDREAVRNVAANTCFSSELGTLESEL